MSRPTPPCPACGGPLHWAKEPLCPECWGCVPEKARRAVRVTQKALGYNPASPKAQREYQVALAAAAGSIV